MIYNYIKCESVLAKIMADLDISEKNLRTTDMKEWIFEAMDKIGAPALYVPIESGVGDEPILKICDRQVPLPLGIQSLDAVAYSTTPDGPWFPMRKDTAEFKYVAPHKHRHHFFQKYEVPCVHEHPHEGFVEQPIKCNAEVYTKSGAKYIDTIIPKYLPHKDLTYFIKPGWLVTNVPHGFIKLAYKRIALDEHGYPLIPDLQSYQEAVYWYVVMKLSFPKYLKGKLGGKGVSSSQNTYFYIQQLWNFYRNLAYAECMMPDSGELRAIKNDWTKLVPDWDSDDLFFGHQGDRQTIINDYYYGY